jgi:mannose-1-phosphate guanylyltransferase/mannose-6-phosphate isomerase
MAPLVPVILSGGSGTRLWPLSRDARPKQFLPLVGDRSLFQQAVLRTRGVTIPVHEPLVVCNEAHRFIVAEQLRELGFESTAIVLEPVGRNTAPAVAVAALIAQRAVAQKGGDPLLLVLPADHLVRDVAAFAAAVAAAAEAAAAGHLVTFGIVPDRPETGYGYLKRGADRGRWSLLERFVEKPDLPTAERYVASGQYLWNSGMFVLGAGTYLRELERHAPAMLAACREAVATASVDADFTRLGAAFAAGPADSIDYAVMEKTDRAAVVPLDAGWNDVGSWSALYDVLDKDAAGNVAVGDAIVEQCRNTYVLASSDRVVAAVGLDNVVVVETPDAVLVIARDSAQSVKKVVDRLKTRG